MQVIIFLRSHVDWPSLTMDDYMRQERGAPGVDEPYLTRLEPRLRMWDETFGISWFAYRQHLRDIHCLNMDRVRGVDAVVRSFSTLQRMNWTREPTWVLPIDDDDWYAPRVVEHVREFDPGKYHYQHWPIVRYMQVLPPAAEPEPVVSHQTPFANYGFCLTNMYAVSNAGIRNVPGHDRQMVLTHHGCSVQKVTGNAKPARIPDSPALPLGVTIKSPASITSVLACDTKEDLVAMVNTYHDRANQVHRLPAYAHEPAMASLELVRELANSRRE